jgi:predicted nucleic acid-binding protein
MSTWDSTFIVIDASLWVARLVPQDAFHATVRTWMDAQRSAGTDFLAPSLLLAEVAGAISRRTGNGRLAARVVEHLEGLPGLRLVDMDSTLLHEAAKLAAELGLRGADATYVATASRLNVPLVTLDDDQRQRAARQVDIVAMP